jgi:hypothetical protein
MSDIWVQSAWIPGSTVPSAYRSLRNSQHHFMISLFRLSQTYRVLAKTKLYKSLQILIRPWALIFDIITMTIIEAVFANDDAEIQM